MWHCSCAEVTVATENHGSWLLFIAENTVHQSCISRTSSALLPLSKLISHWPHGTSLSRIYFACNFVRPSQCEFHSIPRVSCL
jgi:hypothetical protein